MPPQSADMRRMEAMLGAAGVAEYEPRVVGQMLELAYATTRKVLQTAKQISTHCGKQAVDEHDVQLALEFTKVLGCETMEREKTLRFAEERNRHPLPAIRHNYGLKLPNDRFCLLQQNVEWRPELANSAATSSVSQSSFNTLPPQSSSASDRMEITPSHVANMLKRPAQDEYD